MIKLRPITSSDIEYFARWWRDPELIKVTSGSREYLADDQITQYFNEVLAAPKALHYMICAEDKTIGHVSLQEREAGWWETQIVLGDRSSHAHGYGTEAIRQLVQKAAESNITKIYLEVRPENKQAMAAYRKVGFVEVGDVIYTGNPDQPLLIRMELG